MITKVFLDTEFTGLHRDTTLISLAMVADDGREFYAEFTSYAQDQVNDWIAENVIAHLGLGNIRSSTVIPGDPLALVKGNDLYVAAAARMWLEQFDQVEIWADCLAYDWVLFCDLFGGAMEIPGNVYYIPMDLATLLRVHGYDPDLNRAEFAGRGDAPQHNALEDARTIRECHLKAMEIHAAVAAPA